MNIKEWIIATAIFGLPLASFGQNSATKPAEPPQTTGNTEVKMPPSDERDKYALCDSLIKEVEVDLTLEQAFGLEEAVKVFKDIMHGRSTAIVDLYGEGEGEQVHINIAERLDGLEHLVASFSLKDSIIVEGDVMFIKSQNQAIPVIRYSGEGCATRPR